MPNLWTWGIDVNNQPLLDPWWTPSWTAQNRNKSSIQVPPNQFSQQGFPSGLTYVTVTGNYFDTSGDPLSGFLTFWPSTPLTITSNGQVTYMPQRYAGINQTLLGVNQMGDGRIYLWYGQLNVSLMATDNANMTPASFTYHVKENYFEGLQYDIAVPSADSATTVDIHSLIIPGTIRSVSETIPDDSDEVVRIAQVSSQPLAADITTIAAGMTFNPTSYPVNFAFISGPTEPQNTDWHAGSWSSTQLPYIAQILIGPNGLQISPGRYQVWVQVISPAQVPVVPVGFLEIY